MPHMSPILWLNLLILFSIILILMNSTIYSMMKKKEIKSFYLKKKSLIWKW
uniref:ATP synthase F0 subunit 8 n=1 Tax=Phrixothrix hirtus TaxID=94779 RepID=A0A0R6CH88_PHRHR|nr:ATP synthase F0 subunit 8 [Phrixothrix hirtus]